MGIDLENYKQPEYKFDLPIKNSNGEVLEPKSVGYIFCKVQSDARIIVLELEEREDPIEILVAVKGKMIPIRTTVQPVEAD